jgi:dienelactone hydrolase
MLRLATGALLALSAALAGAAAIKEEPVTYSEGGTTLKGFVVYDDAVKGRRPGIVVVHEWWGITKHTRDEARKFAEQGYTAFVADMYGEGKSVDHPNDASGMMKGLMGNPATMQARFNAALAELRKHPTVDAARIGAVGYCMGGAVALNMARVGADLAGVVAFHASLGTATPAAPGKVKAKVLVLNGADDPFIKPEQIEAFRRRRWTTASSTTRARCTPSPTPRRPRRARSSTCRSPITRRWTGRRRPRRRSSSRRC